MSAPIEHPASNSSLQSVKTPPHTTNTIRGKRNPRKSVGAEYRLGLVEFIIPTKDHKPGQPKKRLKCNSTGCQSSSVFLMEFAACQG